MPLTAEPDAGAVFLFENPVKLNLGVEDEGAVVVAVACGAANGLEVLLEVVWSGCLNKNPAGWVDVVFAGSGLGGGPILDSNDDPPVFPSVLFFGSELREKKLLGLLAAGADEELKKVDGMPPGCEGCEDDDVFCSAGLLKNDG